MQPTEPAPARPEWGNAINACQDAAALCRMANRALIWCAQRLHEAGVSAQQAALTNPIWDMPASELDDMAAQLADLAARMRQGAL